ncbi:hypothetical protein, unlikely [Trypanosoma brucei brucei TREU927]|uniref:Transmembrane protein n=1 Tax=Trypanosoma brucei brucei (strain 927/4 GUTat10.1) TaxID=185431 RepID=Q4GZ24_TRYB2|nr:hypothetical protein, unlikely [Trypanosoma brucei brucei TREU927]CAJ16246.1 hypothetical protein, unlikely [Trypanosoma brucei brucei TREU927]
MREMELRMGRTNIPLRSIRCFFRGEVVVGNEQHKKKREKGKERKGKHKGEAYPFFNFFFLVLVFGSFASSPSLFRSPS